MLTGNDVDYKNCVCLWQEKPLQIISCAQVLPGIFHPYQEGFKRDRDGIQFARWHTWIYMSSWQWSVWFPVSIRRSVVVHSRWVWRMIQLTPRKTLAFACPSFSPDSTDFSDYIWRCTHLFDVRASGHRSLTLWMKHRLNLKTEVESDLTKDIQQIHSRTRNRAPVLFLGQSCSWPSLSRTPAGLRTKKLWRQKRTKGHIRFGDRGALRRNLGTRIRKCLKDWSLLFGVHHWSGSNLTCLSWCWGEGRTKRKLDQCGHQRVLFLLLLIDFFHLLINEKNRIAFIN